MRILFVADIVGKTGRKTAQHWVPELRKRHEIDVTIANGENLAGGYGVTARALRILFDAGVDVVTSGNHIWDRADSLSLLAEEPRLLRPANYPDDNPGRGHCTLDVDGVRLGVVNLQGRVFMSPIDDPFRVGRALVERLRAETDVIVVDFHAEATAEKLAFARFIDGDVGAVVGTHTHVPTADEQILPGGTAYITDLGMTGSHSGVIGYRPGPAIERAMLGRRVRMKLAEGNVRLQGSVVDLDERSGLARGIERVDVAHEED